MMGRMGKEALKQKDVQCLNHLSRAFALVDGLKDVGCERDKAGNRELFFNDYVKLVLLYTWNPLIGSIADLQEAAALPNVARVLGIKHFSAGSFSESVRLFEPGQLQPIIAELAQGMAPQPTDPRLSQFPGALTLVDGTVVRGLNRLVKFAVGTDGRYTTTRDGCAVYGWRLHVQLDLETFLPHRLQRTGARNGGGQREATVLRNSLQAGRCYVADGGMADRALFNDIDQAQSSYVIRASENSLYSLVSERLLSQEALDAEIVRDAIVQLDGASHPVRRIEIQVAPHPRRKRSGVKRTELIIVHTNLLELPAELIALIYRCRYTVELFFRILKQLLGLRHLLSQREEGIDIQIYCALIVCVLIQQISGRKPNKAMRNMIGWYLLGLAGGQDVVNFLNRPDNRGVKLRAREELWKKLGF
jgi:hypothetical protein